jgi:hypothetical protein
VFELPAADVDAAAALVPALTVVPAGERPGDATQAWLAAELAEAPEVAYLAGHAQSIQRQRSLLCANRGDRPALDRRAIVAKPFWADGKTGL